MISCCVDIQFEANICIEFICEDEMTRVLKVLQIKAAKLREVALYFVQKTCYMQMTCFAYAWSNMLGKPKFKAFIASLAAVAGEDRVYETLRRGFYQQLLVHAQKAYVDCIWPLMQVSFWQCFSLSFKPLFLVF